MAQDQTQNQGSKAQASPPSVLFHVGNIRVPAVKRFRFEDHFFKNGEGVNITDLHADFRAWFIGSLDENLAETEFSCFSLRVDTPDSGIIAELGGTAPSNMSHMSAVWHLVCQQKNGEAGVLKMEGFIANCFYVYDFFGNLRAVNVWWGGSGWCFFAQPVDSLIKWVAGDQIFAPVRSRRL